MAAHRWRPPGFDVERIHFEGDGTFEYSDTDSGVTNFTYQEPGIYNALFRVRDDLLSWGYDYSVFSHSRASGKCL